MAEDLAESALKAYQSGQCSEAAALLESALTQYSNRPDIWTLYGVVLRRLGRLQESKQAYLGATEVDPTFANAYNNLANLERELGDLRAAAHYYRVAIAKQPAWVESYVTLADTLNQLNEYEQAKSTCEYALSLDPNRPDLFNNLGNACNGLQQMEVALKHYQQAQTLGNGFSPAAYNEALLLEKQGQSDKAAVVLRRYLELEPNSSSGWIKLGDVEKALGHHAVSITCYKQAITLKPDIAEVYNNLGVAYSQLNRWDEAAAAYQQAIARGIKASQAWLNLGNAWHALRRFDEALESYRAGLDLTAEGSMEQVSLLTEMMHVQLKVCDWTGFDGLRERLLLPAMDWQGEGVPPSPFAFLSLPFEVSPVEQQRMAQHYATYVSSGIRTRFTHAPHPQEKTKLRLGYVSADFHNHATAHLMLGLFSRHDRKSFEVFGYSMGRDDSSYYRQRIIAECDQFIDLRGMSDSEAAARIQQDGIDVLIDLKGYTGEARPGIFACRPAPVQVAWLGYPGTMGADFIDYIIADKVVLPPEHNAFYTELPVCLPHSYQVNDIDQVIAPNRPNRAECGLPDQGFIFCCFNSPYKIEPTVFAVWMRILKAVPDSVLWLFANHPTAVKNLKAQARQSGIDDSRLVFAEHAPKDQHLARHQLADLFLDTLYYNAHTTASDSLWAGVPVVTCPGNTFASRVAASLLHAVGLPETIVASLAAYEAIAVELATNSAKLQAIRNRLHRQRTSMPLFDTNRFARDVERAYQAMWQRWADGKVPQPIYLKPE